MPVQQSSRRSFGPTSECVTVSNCLLRYVHLCGVTRALAAGPTSSRILTSFSITEMSSFEKKESNLRKPQRLFDTHPAIQVKRATQLLTQTRAWIATPGDGAHLTSCSCQEFFFSEKKLLVSSQRRRTHTVRIQWERPRF